MLDDKISRIRVTRQSNTPLYIQLKDQIKGLILSGELKPNDRIPPERALSAKLGVSTICVHNSLKELSREGVITRAPRRGSFVAHPAKRIWTQKIVGLMLHKGISPSHPALIQRLAAIDAVLAKQHLHQQLIFFDEAEDQIALFEKFRQSSKVSGLLLLNEVQETLLNYIDARIIPAVRDSGVYRNRMIHCVARDVFHEAYVGVSHLLGHGHKRIGFIKGPPLFINDAAVTGYKLAMEEALGQKGFDPVIKESCFGWESGRRLMAELLREHPDLTAVQCCEDMVALGAWETLRAQGRRVPEDMALIGCGNFEGCLGLNPVLTTFDVGFEATSTTAAEILLRLMDGDVDIPIHTTIYPRLIARQSCGCKPVDCCEAETFALNLPKKLPVTVNALINPSIHSRFKEVI